MKLKLQKPLVIFDLETTGLDIVKARVIQISYIKVYPNGEEERGDEIINPECRIPAEVSALTGITDADVKDKPTFKQIAQKLSEKFKGSDFAGFNYRLRLLQMSLCGRTDHLPQDGAQKSRCRL